MERDVIGKFPAVFFVTLFVKIKLRLGRDEKRSRSGGRVLVLKEIPSCFRRAQKGCGLSSVVGRLWYNLGLNAPPPRRGQKQAKDSRHATVLPTPLVRCHDRLAPAFRV